METFDTLIKDKEQTFESKINRVIKKAQDHLLDLQATDGHWCAELKADTTLPSDYILMMHVLGNVDEEKCKKLCAFILNEQMDEGGWSIYPGGPSEISATVKAYTALKLSGFQADNNHLVRARQKIFDLGGVERTNSFTRIYLALIGQYDWKAVPAIPPEIVLLPNWFYFNIYEISSWSRGIIVPLTLIWNNQPVTQLPDALGIHELFPNGHPTKLAFVKGNGLINGLFIVWDHLMKSLDRWGIRPFRKKALHKASNWMLDRLERSDGLGAIFPAMVNSIFALKELKISLDDPIMKRALKQLKDFEVEENGAMHIQPCFSPIWDTGLVLMALSEYGSDIPKEKLEDSLCWLLDREIRFDGDWKIKNPKTIASGWAFEYKNDFYPDIDDTIMVIMALKRCLIRYENVLSEELKSRTQAAINRSHLWTDDMQNRDGGWAAFDRDNNRMIFSKIPFADHNAMLDPSSVDITGRTLEMKAHFGISVEDPCVQRAIAFIKKEQTSEGCWYGRWGVNYIYGTWQVLKGLSTIGENMNEEYCQSGAAWLRDVQNKDGGWGESIATYDDPSLKGQGESTPSQTAWALMGLFSVGDFTSEVVLSGIQHLLETQNEDGSWDEVPYTGTGFPKVFYIKYDFYRNYFPILALSYYLNATQKNDFYKKTHTKLS